MRIVVARRNFCGFGHFEKGEDMNALVKKEIRVLLPSFLIGCVLTLANWFSFWENLFLENPSAFNSILSMIPLVVCPAVAVMIALDSFGGEVSSGTFAVLLAQPISRVKIWQTKILLLAIALLVVGILWFVPIFYVRLFMVTNHDSYKDLYDLFVIAVMFALVVFSGGLWTVLLLRQVAAAFWFTLLVPGVILVVLVGLLADQSNEFIEGMVVTVLGLYSLAGFFFARWLFFRAQDVQWSGGTIVMPEMRGLPAWLSRSAVKRIFRPRAALWRKEIQLHQSQFVMAFTLLLLHLGVLATRTFGHFRKNSSTEFILEVFWCLWLVMPLLVGCAAVAEERKLGTLEGQLCLPVKRRTQFAIKFSVALFLSVLLGAAMPLLLEGTKILPNLHFELGSIGNLEPGWQNQMSATQFFLWNCLGILNGFLPLLMLAGIATAFGVISFYVSSLTRNTLQTLAPAVLGILMGFFGLVLIAQMQDFDLDFLWRGPLPFFIGVPVMLVALLALAFWNFQHVRIGWKMWRRNFFAFVLALVFAMTATSAVYHRFWEKFTPFEPPHGAARLSQSNPGSLSTRWDEISVRLPDGKIWMNYFISGPTVLNPLALMLGNFKVALGDGKFINGSNWMTVHRAGREFVGIKTDGSLWVSEKPWQRSQLQNGGWKINKDEMQDLVLFGNETNWSSFVPVGLSTLLVKNDGTLWRWGVTNFDFKRDQWPGLRTFTPYRLGTESNWAEAEAFQNYQDSSQMFLRKTDGSLWTRNNYSWNTNGQTMLEIEPGFIVQSVKNLGRDKFRSVAKISYGLQYGVGVRDDGTFRIWADERLIQKERNYEWFAADLPIGDGTNWIAVAGRGNKIVTLKNDGSLWLWNFHRPQMEWNAHFFENEIQDPRPVRLGTHSDWIAISGSYGSVSALAADGSLWYWPLEDAAYYFSELGNYNNAGNSHFEPLLDISRKPQLLGNIFGEND
jgi:ABC-type transport system involved in multi-copper enzyme maturation permease subunit